MLSSVLAGPAEWRCWQTGIELRYADTTLIRIRELLGYLRYSPDYRKLRSAPADGDGLFSLSLSCCGGDLSE